MFLSLSEKAKVTDSFGLNGNDKVCEEVCYRIITISHFLKYIIVRFIIEIYESHLSIFCENTVNLK